jgi:hypothetical protein
MPVENIGTVFNYSCKISGNNSYRLSPMRSEELKNKSTLMIIICRHTELVKADVGGKQQYHSWMRIKINR